MRLNEPARRRRRFDLTPLIDVVFLLLVFFMLASTFLSFSALPLTPQGRADTPTAPLAPDEVAILRLTGPDAMTLNGEPLRLATLAARLEAAVAAGRRHLVLQTVGAANVDGLARALHVARKSRFKTVVLAR
ncbi:MAG: biopolymer transporter ExbD [Pseudomonadota bacterium]